MRIGDWGLSLFKVPTGQMEHLGFTEGKEYAPGHPLTATIVARYRSGRDFAGFYARARFAKVCQAAGSQKPEDCRPDFQPDARRRHQHYDRGGDFSMRPERAGEAGLRVRGDGTLSGEWSTVRAELPCAQGSGEYHSPYLPIGRNIHFTENPQWFLKQAQITAANAAAGLKTFRMSLQQIDARYQQWSASMARHGQSFSDALHGRTLTLDPSTGQQREVWTGTGSTKWIDGLGNVVSSNLAPGASFRALQVIGRYRRQGNNNTPRGTRR
jgi:hypothetical protein